MTGDISHDTRHIQYLLIKHNIIGTSLVAQLLRICLPMQGTRVQALVQEDPTCCGAMKPMRTTNEPVL